MYNVKKFLFIGPDAKKIQKEEQHKIDNAVEELTEDEQKEKEVLLYQGNFTSFVLFFLIILFR